MASAREFLRRARRALGPAIPAASLRDAAVAALGAFVGLAVTGLLVLTPQVDLQLGLYLIAPFGASAVLLFAVPNSPLAQPWSAVVGNMASALVGVAVAMTVPDPALRVALAVGAAIFVMSLLRAMHPPGGAVAMTAALAPEAVDRLGFAFALAPVMLGTVALVGCAAAYARLTRRRYPFRHGDEPNAHGTLDAAPDRRLDLSREELRDILRDLRQSANVGVTDLSRLIVAAEMRAASHRLRGLVCGDVMSRDLVTVGPDAPLDVAAELFRRHNFTSLPVVDEQGRILGAIFQIHLIRQGREDASRLRRSYAAAMARLLDRQGRGRPTAKDVMATALPRTAPDAPLGVLLPLLAQGNLDAVPVVEHGRLVGIVTRTDLIGALARRLAA